MALSDRSEFRLSKKTIIVITGGILIAGCLWLLMILFVCEVPLDLLTRTNIRRTRVRIRRYYTGTGSLPDKLVDLPPDDANKGNSTADGWGRPIGYRVEGKMVILESLGEDGQPGGKGMDEDILLIFDPKISELLESFSSPQPASDPPE